MKKLLQILLVFMLCSTAQARESVPIVNFENLTINTASGRKISPDEVKAAILHAAKPQQWSIIEKNKGNLIGTLDVRGKHTVIIDITYSNQALSVKYKDSTNMKFKVEDGTEMIHPFYNKWVKSLINNIRKEFERL